MNIIKYVSLCFLVIKYVYAEFQHHILNAPLHVNRNYYDILKANGGKIKIIDVPKEMDRYNIHGGDKAKGISQDFYKYQMIPLPGLTAEQNAVYLSLHKKTKDGEPQEETKTVVVILPDDEAGTPTGPCYERPEFRQDIEIECIIEINWYSNQNDQISFYYYIAGGVLTALIIIIVIICLSIKLREKRKKTADAKGNNSGDRVLYADLEIHSLPQSNRKPAVEESPYAEIMHQDCVRFSQLDQQQAGPNVQKEESPYVEIILNNDTKT